jgi:putative DNA primase/helicase
MRRDAVVDMLKGLPEVRDSGDWDNDPDLLAVPNGVVCLRTGELMEGTPGQRITKAAKVPYDPDAKCPRFEQFLREIFADDPEMPAYMGRLLGYGLTGRTDEQAFAVFHGSGSNGKSVLLTVLRNILGDHAVTVPFDMFTTSGKARGGPDAELLVGARLALASETNRSAVLDSAAVKNATGGEEITVNPKYRDPYSFKPIALILLATNYRPTVKEQDEGTWRRIKLVPFSQKFEGAQKDLTLHETLADEYPGILAWLVRGSVEWYANGLQDPESVRLAVQEYRESSDPLDGFYPGVLEPFPGGRVTNADAWNAYTNWAANEGVDAFRQSSTLSKALIERGRGAVGTAKSGPKRYLTGVRISGAPVGPPGPGIFDTAG